VGVSRDCPNLLSQKRVKLRTSNFVRTLSYRLNRKESPLKISGKVAVGVVRDSRNFFRAPICRAHRAVIFAIALLSCSSSLVLHFKMLIAHCVNNAR